MTGGEVEPVIVEGVIIPEDRERQINREVADAVGWDDRKELADVFQDHCPALTDRAGWVQFMDALVAVAQFGARRAAENLIGDE